MELFLYETLKKVEKKHTKCLPRATRLCLYMQYQKHNLNEFSKLEASRIQVQECVHWIFKEKSVCGNMVFIVVRYVKDRTKRKR